MRKKFTIKNLLPIITWRPWNPVETKKIDPETLSAIVKSAYIYSEICKNVKYIPNIIVNSNLIIAAFRFILVNLWWLQVIVNPELNKTTVFNNGILIGSITAAPIGDQTDPS